MAKPRILYITEAITPYLPDFANSSLGRDLPVMSQAEGHEVRIFMPRFGSINERRNQLHEVIRLSGINISIDDTDHPLIIKVASMHPSRIQVYFVDNDDYFQRLDSDADVLGTNRADNDERTIFFNHGTMETVKKLRWDADTVHCLGWMTALCTLGLRSMYNAEPGVKRPTIIYTMLPGQDPDTLDEAMVSKLREEGYSDDELKDIIENPGKPEALHKLAMRNADAITLPADAPAELLEFAQELNKPLLIMQPAQDGQKYDTEAFSKFYASLKEK